MAFAATRRCCQRVWHNPTTVHFAPYGSYDEVIAEVVKNRKVLLMTYPQAEVTGLWTSLISVLGDDRCSLSKMFIACPELPDLNEFRGLYRRVRNFIGDRDDTVILAVGGGSCIDLAKVMALAKSGVEFEEILEQRIARGKRIDALAHVPVVAVPTTAGTGSEVTPWAAIWDMQNKKKYSVQGSSLWPEAAVIDPSLAQTCPREVTRNCGLDALSHALEAIWNRNHNPVSDTLAVSAARGVMAALPRVLAVSGEGIGRQQGGRAQGAVAEEEKEARTALALAALRAGLAFSNTETALCHALSYPLTMEKSVKHGLACSFSLPRVLRLAYGHDAGRDAVIDEVFRGADETQPWEALDAFLRRVGVSTELRDYGFEGEEDFARRAREGMRQRRGRNFLLAGQGEGGVR